MTKKLLIIFALFAFTAPAQALFEVRAGYGVNTPADEDTGAGADLSTMSGFNLDAIIEPPLIPFGFGLRYETMGFDVEAGNASFESDMERISLLVNYRLINTLLYVGAIGTIGFANDVTVDYSNQISGDYSADLTYSLGAEAGVSLGIIQVGAELGYNFATYETTNNAVPSEIDFDGVYAKALVGFGF
jgi:hypothetical protein